MVEGGGREDEEVEFGFTSPGEFEGLSGAGAVQAQLCPVPPCARPVQTAQHPSISAAPEP